MKIFLISFAAIAPQLILMVAATILLLFGAYNIHRRWSYTVAFVSYFLSGEAVYFAGGHRFPTSGTLSFLYNDKYTIFFFSLFLLIGALVSLLSIRYFEMHEKLHCEYFAMVMFAVVGMMVMAASQDLLVMYLGLEITSLTSYVLAGYLIPQKRSQESALKYFFTGAFGSAILLFGVAYLYGATGSVAYAEIGQKAATQLKFGTFFAIGTIFLLAGFAFKVAAVPFQMGAPDVYDGAPTPVTAFVMVGVKAATFAAFARIIIVSLDIGPSLWFDAILASLSALTMLWGSVAAISQRSIKRMLAYASIAHAGYLLLAITARSDWTGPSILFYLLGYSLATLGAFAVILVFENASGKNLNIDEYAGLGSRYPIIAICLTIFLLSLAGFPATIGFVGKWFVFSGAIKTGQTYLIILAILGGLTSVVSVYYSMRVVYFMFMMQPNENTASAHSPFPVEQRISIMLAAAVLLFGLLPPVGVANRGILKPIALQHAQKVNPQPKRRPPRKSLTNQDTP